MAMQMLDYAGMKKSRAEIRRVREDWVSTVATAEAEINREIEQMSVQCASETDEFTEKLEAKIERADLRRRLEEAYKERVAEHVQDNAILASIQSDNEAQAANAVGRLNGIAPLWRLEAVKALDILGDFRETYSNDTYWRSRVHAHLKAMVADCEERYARGPESIGFAAVLKRINLGSANEIRPGLEAAAAVADAAQAAADPEYAVRLAELSARRAALEAGTEDYEEKAAAAVARALHEKREIERRLTELDRLLAGEDAKARQFNFYLDKTTHFQEELADILLSPVTRENHAALKAMFNKLLARCAYAGAWSEALNAYEAMAGCRLEVDRHTYHTLITACRNAEPPEPAKAAEVLQQMEACGIVATTATYNIVLDCCNEAGQWRRALLLLKEMRTRDPPLRPNSASFKAVEAVCAKASVDEAPDVYRAMQFAGVPDANAYSCSVRKTGLGRDLPAPPGAVAAALAAAGAVLGGAAGAGRGGGRGRGRGGGRGGGSRSGGGGAAAASTRPTPARATRSERLALTTSTARASTSAPSGATAGGGSFGGGSFGGGSFGGGSFGGTGAGTGAGALGDSRSRSKRTLRRERASEALLKLG
jgi:pentatricopeptide repeat protein